MDKGFPALFQNAEAAMHFSQACGIRAFQRIYVCICGGRSHEKTRRDVAGFLKMLINKTAFDYLRGLL